MDTSETYIKMCEKATEIQRLLGEYLDALGNVGAWYTQRVHCKGHFEDWHGLYKYCPVCAKELEVSPHWGICQIITNEEDGVIWLPRQDQLQDMVELSELEKYWVAKKISLPFYHIIETRLVRFFDFVMIGECMTTQRFSEYCLQFTSMEQLWLAWVMRDKHNKTWNGEDWVKMKLVNK